ncbi:unnamed protein product, partial [Staurois parvus]
NAGYWHFPTHELTALCPSSTCQCPSVPALGGHPLPPASAHQCHISMPISATINARYQCPSKLPSQCHPSVPVSVTYQCQSVPPISAAKSVPPISASQCRLSVCISAAYQ